MNEKIIQKYMEHRKKVAEYTKKKYETIPEYRQRQKQQCRERYKRKTINCTICNLRIPKETSPQICKKCQQKLIKKKISKEPQILVVADSIDKYQIHFTCPNCYVSYNKDGTARKGAKHATHHHGSNGDLSNRKEYRNAHCLDTQMNNFLIIVDDTTKRINIED